MAEVDAPRKLNGLEQLGFFEVSHEPAESRREHVDAETFRIHSRQKLAGRFADAVVVVRNQTGVEPYDAALPIEPPDDSHAARVDDALDLPHSRSLEQVVSAADIDGY